MASHEFRTPLTSVLSSLELMEEYVRRAGDDLGEQFTSRMQKHLIRSREAVKHLDEMVAEMLVLEKSHSGQINCHPEPFDMNALISEVLFSLQSVAEKHEVALRQESPDPAMVNLDPRLVRHVFSNLVSNALRFSKPGTEVEVRLSVDENHVRLTVSDQGMGIPKQDQQRVFETFFRGDNGQHVEGSGLGLSIVKRFVDLHSGHVDLDSTPGKGTTFYVAFPVMTADNGLQA